MGDLDYDSSYKKGKYNLNEAIQIYRKYMTSCKT